MKTKLTPRARRMWANYYPEAAIRKSIMQGWRGVFKPDANQRKPAQESEFANAF